MVQMFDEGTIFSVSGVIYLPHSLPHVSLVFRCTFTLSMNSYPMCSCPVHVRKSHLGLFLLDDVKQAPTSSPPLSAAIIPTSTLWRRTVPRPRGMRTSSTSTQDRIKVRNRQTRTLCLPPPSLSCSLERYQSYKRRSFLYVCSMRVSKCH